MKRSTKTNLVFLLIAFLAVYPILGTDSLSFASGKVFPAASLTNTVTEIGRLEMWSTNRSETVGA